MSEDRGAGREVRGAEGGVDAVIDRAVREMLDIEPPAGLRGRVLRRIESGDRAGASGLTRRLAWLALPIAAAALLILALRTPSPAPMNPVAPVSVARVDPRQPTPAARPAVSSPQTSGVRPLDPRRRPVRVVATTAYAPTEETSTIAPLEAIIPIQVVPIARRSVTTEEIAVRPLNPITDVQIAPLTPPDRRN